MFAEILEFVGDLFTSGEGVISIMIGTAVVTAKLKLKERLTVKSVFRAVKKLFKK